MSDTPYFYIGEKTRGRSHLSLNSRRRHMAVFGKSGFGKTTLLANLAVRDMRAGDGLCVLDPHGDLAQALLNYVPKHRTNDVIYFDPANQKHCPGLNLLDDVPTHMIDATAGAVMAVFTHLFELSYKDTPRLLGFLRQAVLALLEAKGMSLAHVPYMLGLDPASRAFRADVLSRIKNPAVRRFWQIEFEANSDRYNTEAAAPVLTRIQSFLTYPVVANIIAQPRSTFDFRQAMDERKIIIANLATGAIGEEAANLLGSLMVSRIQVAAMSRIDTPEDDRADFGLIVDEYSNFTTMSFAKLLSEARKMRVSLTMAGQYRAQATQEIFDAVAGNVGALVVFRVGASDAEYFTKELHPASARHLTELPPFTAYTTSFDRPGGDLVACYPFPALTHEPRRHLVENASRRQFTRPRRLVRPLVNEIIGMGMPQWDEGELGVGR